MILSIPPHFLLILVFPLAGCLIPSLIAFLRNDRYALRETVLNILLIATVPIVYGIVNACALPFAAMGWITAYGARDLGGRVAEFAGPFAVVGWIVLLLWVAIPEHPKGRYHFSLQHVWNAQAVVGMLCLLVGVLQILTFGSHWLEAVILVGGLLLVGNVMFPVAIFFVSARDEGISRSTFNSAARSAAFSVASFVAILWPLVIPRILQHKFI